MLDVCLLGTGGMMPLPSRALTALMVRYNGMGVLIDCGEGTQVSIRQKGWSFHSIDVICFTHYHGDHISGLPGLLLSIGNSDRVKPVTIIGPKGLERVVNALRVIAPELPFELKFMEIKEKEEKFNINGLEIEAFKVNHNILCYAYVLNVHRAGKFIPQKAKENNVPMKFWTRLQKGETIIDGDITYTQDMILGEKRKGIKLVYCTDTRPIQVIEEKAKNADLFICEGMYGQEDKNAKAKENKHMTFYEAAKLAKNAKVSELWLTHYSPSLVRPEDYKEQVRKIFTNTFISKDRRSVTLEFEKE